MFMAFCEECGCQYTLNSEEIIYKSLRVKCKSCNFGFTIQSDLALEGGAPQGTIRFRTIVEIDCNQVVPLLPSSSPIRPTHSQLIDCANEDISVESLLL